MMNSVADKQDHKSARNNVDNVNIDKVDKVNNVNGTGTDPDIDKTKSEDDLKPEKEAEAEAQAATVNPTPPATPTVPVSTAGTRPESEELAFLSDAHLGCGMPMPLPEHMPTRRTPGGGGVDTQPGAFDGTSRNRLASVNYESLGVSVGTSNGNGYGNGNAEEDEEWQQQQQAGPTANSNVNVEGLAVANPVTEQEQDNPRATALDLEQKTRDRRNYLTKLVLGLFVLLLVIIGLVLVLFFTVGKQEQDKPQTETTNTTTSGTTSGTTSPPSVQDQFLALLPDWSIDAIQEDQTSSQSRALQWLLEDPKLLNYTDERKVQRYALATLFYHANGDTWKNASGWMDYNTHECQWHMAWISSFLNSELQYYPNLKGPCYDTDQPDQLPGETYRHMSQFDNGLKGTIPEEIHLLTSLKTIVFDFNPALAGTISTNIGTLDSLEHIAISITSISGTIPSELGLLATSLRNLYFFNDNLLNSTMPTELGLLQNIRFMGLFGDPLLHGTIPNEFVFPKARSLYFSASQFTGTIPTGLAASPDLGRLSLRLNNLTGTIPSEFGRCTNLWQMVVDGNSLTGTVPQELGVLAAEHGVLQNLNLTANNLEGTIPPGLCLLDTPGWQNGTNPPGAIIEAPIQVEHDCNEKICGCSCTCA